MGRTAVVSRSWIALVLWGCAAPPAPQPPSFAGPYFGQTASRTPALFAPGLVSRRYNEMNAALAPGGDELYFTMKSSADDSGAIMVVRQVGGVWQPPQIAAFSGRYFDVDPMFSPDGVRLYFSSYRPRAAGATAAETDADIWYVERTAAGFGAPVHVGAPVSTPNDDFHPSVTRDGTLYYSQWDAKRRTGDLFRARLVDGAYQVDNAGAELNSEATEYDPFIAPDESYVIFVSTRPGGRGDGDLYISFRGAERWSEPKNLGGEINSAAREFCPVVSPDGKYFLFTSKRSEAAAPGAPSTTAQWTARYDAIQNGTGNVYWLEQSVLDQLR